MKCVNPTETGPAPTAIGCNVRLPMGTWVENAIRGETYILREDGRRPVLPGEFNGANYLDLLHSDPPSPSRRTAMLAGVGCLFALMVVAWLLASRLRKAVAG